MKRRTFLISALLVIAVVGLFWGLWEITTPDIVASSSDPVKSFGSSELVEQLPSGADAVSASAENLNSSTPLDTTESPIADGSSTLDTTEDPAETTDVAAEPSAASSPPTPDAVLTTALADAEHHVFKLRVGTVEVTITRFHRGPDGLGTRTAEFVEFYVWPSSSANNRNLGASVFDLPLWQLNPEDQQYSRDWAWAQQQAASTASAAPAPEQ